MYTEKYNKKLIILISKWLECLKHTKTEFMIFKLFVLIQQA